MDFPVWNTEAGTEPATHLSASAHGTYVNAGEAGAGVGELFHEDVDVAVNVVVPIQWEGNPQGQEFQAADLGNEFVDVLVAAELEQPG